MSSTRSRVAAIVAAGLALALYELLLGSKVRLFFGDFRAFYCAGAGLLHARNPYGATSLYACERAPMPFGLYRALPGIAVPAPLPGYALILFAPLGALAYPVACALWMLMLFASGAASVLLLAKLIDRPVAIALVLLVPGFAVLVIPYGELATIVIAALLAMALALRRGEWNAAALAAAFAMILPHVALPALLAVFLLCAPMRSRLLLLAAVLAALDVAAGGMRTALAYFTRVLPAHALSEVGSTSQYGLTWALNAIGLPGGLAIHLGEASYALMLLAGVLVAYHLVRRSGDRAYAVLVPPAFAVFGGVFMHYTEIMAALPAAALLYTRAGGALRSMLLLAVLLLALPWGWVLSQPQLMIVFAIAGGLIASLLGDSDLRGAFRTALACAVGGAIIVVAGFHFGTGLNAHPAAVHLDPRLAEASWAQYIRSQRASSGAVWWFAKAPTWLGLGFLTLGCAYGSAKKNFVAPVVVEDAPAAP